MRVPAHSVCAAIRDDIVAGVHEPGGRLAEEALARRYGVSRVPVREALRTLESEGFVTTRRYAGAWVAEPTAAEGADLLELRLLLEPLAAARAAARRDEAHLTVLRALVRLGRERAGRGAGEDCAELWGWFHETLAQACASPALIAPLTQVRRKIAWMYVADPSERGAQAWDGLGAVTDAVARGDAERARSLMAQHTERSSRAHRPRGLGAAGVAAPSGTPRKRGAPRGTEIARART
ncbi:GntR family transcriptional regulator [Streptomyces sp. NPDC006711]|uniref:GntR family transcriptional regulator n=1 Tax=unclassified Streptomyces TaxID=2593676 RepID=UPI0036CAF5C8